MKKKLLSLALALIMLLSLMPTAAFADVAPPVAKIGTTEYATLQAAVNAAQDGDTVQLFSDVTLNGTPIKVTKGITIDFGTFKLSGVNCTTYPQALLQVNAPGKTVTLNGTTGGIDAKADTYGTRAIAIEANCKLVIEGGVYSSMNNCTIYADNAGAELVMNGGTINTNFTNVGNYKQSIVIKGDLTIKDVTIKNEATNAAGNVIDETANDAKVSITDSKIDAKNITAVVAATSTSTVEIKGTEVTTTSAALVYGGDITIGEGTKFESTSGRVISGATSAKIEGGSFKTDSSNGAFGYSSFPLDVEGGSFEVTKLTSGSGSTNLKISGGEFEIKDATNAKQVLDNYLAPTEEGGKVQVEINETAYTVDESGNVEEVLPVAKIGDVKFYSLADAIAAAQLGETIVLLADSAENITLPVGVTFNTNGKTYGGKVSAPTGYVVKEALGVYTVADYVLTVKAENAAATAEIAALMTGTDFTADMKAFAEYAAAHQNTYKTHTDKYGIELYGKVTLTDDIVVPSNRGWSSTMSIFIFKDTVIDLNGHTITQQAGTGQSGYSLFNVKDGAALTIKDSSEDDSGKISVALQAFEVYSSPNSKIVLEGGTVAADAPINATYDTACASYLIPYANGNIELKGGKLEVPTARKDLQGNDVTVVDGIFVGESYSSGKVTIPEGSTVVFGEGNIEGVGTFVEGIENINVEAGLILVHNEDGTYTIATPVAQIGDVNYASLADAIEAYNAAPAGDYVLTVKAGEHEVSPMTIKQAVGKTLTIAGEKDESGLLSTLKLKVTKGSIFNISGSSSYSTGATVIKDLILDISVESTGTVSAVSTMGGNADRYASNVTIENCKIIGSCNDNCIALSGPSGTSPVAFTLKGCTTVNVGRVAQGYFAPGGGFDFGLDIIDCAITGDTMVVYNAQSGSAGNETISGNTVESLVGDYGFRLSGGNVTFTDNTVKTNFTDELGANKGLLVMRNNAATVTAEGNSVTAEPGSTPLPEIASSGVKTDVKDTAGEVMQTVEAGKTAPVLELDPVAQIGEKEYYSLATAMNAANKGETVELLCDIDLAGENWTPIADFKGTLDGNGFTIKNMTVNDTAHPYAGFVCLLSGTIKNVTFDNASVTGKRIGVVAGSNGAWTDAVVENVNVTNSKLFGEQKCGGIMGFVRGIDNTGEGSFTVKNCTVENFVADEIAAGDTIAQAGGLLGYVDYGVNLTVENCSVKNIVINNDWYSSDEGNAYNNPLYASNEFIGVVNNNAGTGNYDDYSVVLKGNTVILDPDHPNNIRREACNADCSLIGGYYNFLDEYGKNPTQIVVDEKELTDELGINKEAALAELDAIEYTSDEAKAIIVKAKADVEAAETAEAVVAIVAKAKADVVAEAKIGEVYYATVAEAVKAANAGDNIVCFVEGGSITINYTVGMFNIWHLFDVTAVEGNVAIPGSLIAEIFESDACGATQFYVLTDATVDLKGYDYVPNGKEVGLYVSGDANVTIEDTGETKVEFNGKFDAVSGTATKGEGVKLEAPEGKVWSAEGKLITVEEELAIAKEAAVAELEALKPVSDEAKSIIEQALEDVAAAKTAEKVEAVVEKAKADADAADKALAAAQATAMDQLDALKPVSDEAKAIIDAAIAAVNAATTPDAAANATNGVADNVQKADDALAKAQAEAKDELIGYAGSNSSDAMKEIIARYTYLIEKETDINNLNGILKDGKEEIKAQSREENGIIGDLVARFNFLHFGQWLRDFIKFVSNIKIIPDGDAVSGMVTGIINLIRTIFSM